MKHRCDTLVFLSLGLILLQSVVQASLPELNRSFEKAAAQTSNNRLTVTTGVVQRTWQWTGKGLSTISLKQLDTGKEWVATQSPQIADWDLGDLGLGTLISLKAFEHDDDRFTSRHLAVEAEIHYRNLHLKYVIWAYPNASGLRTQLWLKKPGNVEWQGELFRPDVSETLNLLENPGAVTAFGYMAGIKADMKHLILRETPLPVEGVVDWASGLVIENETAGIILVKESHKHTHMHHGDLVTGAFERKGTLIKVTGVGMRTSDLRAERYRFCWANWTILYHGSQTKAALTLKQFDRLRFPVHPNRDITIMANTWGTEDTQPPCKYKAREENVLRELESCAELGIDILQIDDGWQDENWRPRSQTSANFVTHDGQVVKGIYEVYPEGFGKVRARAEELGMKLGLWHAWRAPLASIKANYDDGNFKAFKLDFAQLSKKDDFDMLYYKGRDLVKHSGYTAVVNWDVTEIAPRMGYYFGRDCGNLYLANRKANTLRKQVQYDPFKVLRDAWLLARYTNLNKIQVTFQNKDHTPAKADSDARKYTHAYNLGITLMSSPIFFCETQYLNEAAREEIKAILKCYRAQRERMYQGYVFGIGSMPDNAGWTGFQNYHPKTGDGYLTVFRELHNEQPRAKLTLHFYKPGTRLRLVDLSSGSVRHATLDDQSQVEFAIHEAPGFRFLKVISDK